MPANEQITRMVVAPQRRALITANAIAEGLGLPLECRSCFHEVGGLYDRAAGAEGHDPATGECLPGVMPLHGSNFEQLQMEAPMLTTHDGTITTEGWWRGGKETQGQQLERCRRAVACLWQMCRDHQTEGDQGAIAIVGHGKFTDMMLQELLQVGCGDGARLIDTTFLSFNTSMFVLDLVPGAEAHLRGTVGVVACNAVPHMDSLDDRGGKLRTAQKRDTVRLTNLLK